MTPVMYQRRERKPAAARRKYSFTPEELGAIYASKYGLFSRERLDLEHKVLTEAFVEGKKYETVAEEQHVGLEWLKTVVRKWAWSKHKLSGHV